MHSHARLHRAYPLTACRRGANMSWCLMSVHAWLPQILVNASHPPAPIYHIQDSVSLIDAPAFLSGDLAQQTGAHSETTGRLHDGEKAS